MYSVYVIESSEGKLYTGQTNNITRRLFEHNSGLSKTTKAGTNWRLVYSEQYSSRSEAIRRERWLKTGVGRDYLKAKLKEWK
jgi:putative endonuclease